jgi:hypothetical protein
MKNYLTWREKKAIVDEAVAAQNIRATAVLHKVDPAQIRRWKRDLPPIFDDPYDRSHKKVRLTNLKMIHTGTRRVDGNKFDAIREFIERIRETDRVVTCGMMCIEFKRLYPEEEVEVRVLKKRIYRWLKIDHLVKRRVTHVAQNTRYEEEIIQQFTSYVNEQIAERGFCGEDIVNIDETNIEFDMVGNITIAPQGTKTISIK